MADTSEPPLQEVIKEDSLIIPSLPEEVIFDILSLLPVKSILRFRCVCKNWCTKLFKDPKFVKLHLNHAIGSNKFFLLLKIRNRPMYLSSSAHNDHSVVEIESPFSLDDIYLNYRTYGSCNGLILLSIPFEYEEGVILWNPSTREIKKIPEPVIDVYDDHDLVYTTYGFCYSSVLDDYKIVSAKMYYITDQVTDGCQVEVYSLTSNSWKTIPDVIPYDLFLGSEAIKPAICNGAIHWIGLPCQGRELSKAVSVVIISFDTEKDSFKEVPLTQELQDLCYDQSISLRQASLSEDICLGHFCGCLSLLQCGELCSAWNNNGDVSIWVMKEYGEKDSWTKMFSVSTASMERSVKYSTMTVRDLANGMILFVKDRSSLVLYDPKDETARVVDTCGLPFFTLKGSSCSYVDMYVESLVSLNSKG